jgi:hypothetical protein
MSKKDEWYLGECSDEDNDFLVINLMVEGTSNMELGLAIKQWSRGMDIVCLLWEYIKHKTKSVRNSPHLRCSCLS